MEVGCFICGNPKPAQCRGPSEDLAKTLDGETDAVPQGRWDGRLLFVMVYPDMAWEPSILEAMHSQYTDVYSIYQTDLSENELYNLMVDHYFHQAAPTII